MNSEQINQILDEVANKLGITDYSVVFKSGNKKGEGYLGELTFLDLKDQKSGLTKHLVIKIAFDNETIRKAAPIRMAFVNEVNFYSNVLPILQNFGKEIGITVFDKIPTCYLSSAEENKEFLVMDDLRPLGFEVFNKKKIVPYDHIELIFKTYAKFHATSILFPLKKPKEYQKLLETIPNVMNHFLDNEQYSYMINGTFETAAKTLIPGKDDAVKKTWEGYLGSGMKIYGKSMFYKGGNPVLCHGDCWSNNMMFKYGANNDLDIKIIDWQMLKIGSVVHDLSYSLYSGASKETFDKLDDLLNSYYESFSSIFKEVGENAEEIYPLSIIKEEWRIYGIYGLVSAVIIIKGKTANDEDMFDMNDMAANGELNQELLKKIAEGSTSEEFDRRVRELLIHGYEINCL